MFYLLDNRDGFTIFHEEEHVPAYLRSQLVEVESLPEGDGILRRAEDGSFYFEEVVVPEEAPAEKPIEEKIDELAHMQEELKSDNVVTFEVLATMYEAIVELQAQILEMKNQ